MGGGASKVEAVGDKVGLIDVGPANDKLIQLMSIYFFSIHLYI